jgi:hypothetical protein
MTSACCHIPSALHPLHESRAQHPLTRVHQAPLHPQPLPHLGRRETVRMGLEQRHNTPARLLPRVPVLGRWLPRWRVLACGEGGPHTSGGLCGSSGLLDAQRVWADALPEEAPLDSLPWDEATHRACRGERDLSYPWRPERRSGARGLEGTGQSAGSARCRGRGARRFLPCPGLSLR